MEAILHAIQEGAPFSYINLVILTPVVIAIIIERTIHILTKYKVNAEEFMKQVRKLVQAGNIDRAIKLCEAAPLPLLQVVRSGLTQANKGDEAVIGAIDESMEEVVPALEKRIGSLWTFANLATLIGLLGTISGLIRAFQAAVGKGDPKAAQEALMAGIAEAMWNTLFGLGIAVVCMTAHLILHGMAKKQKKELEKSSMKLENLLTMRKAA